MDGVPVSYQLWNNYLIKNQNYWEKLMPLNKEQQKSIETIVTLKEEVEYAMNAIQPHLKRRNDCVIMVIHVLTQPDWINIPCFQKIPAFVVCQKIINQIEGNIFSTRNYSLNKEAEMCQYNKLLIENKCISFIKYDNLRNMSELKYNTHDIGSTVIINLENKTLFQYFTIIQHFYTKAFAIYHISAFQQHISLL